MKVGLTGGIASGKNCTATLWQQWGAEVIDSDQLAHQAMGPGLPAYQEVVGHFGPGVLKSNGTIDRRKLGDIVFGDERQRETLNRIVHPRVREQWRRRVAEFLNAKRGP